MAKTRSQVIRVLQALVNETAAAERVVPADVECVLDYWIHGWTRKCTVEDRHDVRMALTKAIRSQQVDMDVGHMIGKHATIRDVIERAVKDPTVSLPDIDLLVVSLQLQWPFKEPSDPGYTAPEVTVVGGSRYVNRRNVMLGNRGGYFYLTESNKRVFIPPCRR